MSYHYVVLETRSQAFLLDARLNFIGVKSEISFVPRAVSRELCNLGVKIPTCYITEAIEVIRSSGLPGVRVYRENITVSDSEYIQEYF